MVPERACGFVEAGHVEWGWCHGQCWTRAAVRVLWMCEWVGSLGWRLAGRTGEKCVRGEKWPTVSEVLGGTHSQWGLGEGLEPPHTLAPRIGPVESS